LKKWCECLIKAESGFNKVEQEEEEEEEEEEEGGLV